MKDEIIKRLMKGERKEIQETLRGIKKPNIRKRISLFRRTGIKDYMNDMNIAQKYAALNRKAMIDEIVTKMDWQVTDQFTTIHNYIDIENMILRKECYFSSER